MNLTYSRVHFKEMGRQALAVLLRRCAGLRPLSANVTCIGSDLVVGSTTVRPDAG